MMRKQEIDILRGMMIICVVIGHCSFAHKLPINVFWFHMPVFFMISGFLTNPPVENPFKNKIYLRKKGIRYVIPYFSYSILFYIIFRPEGIFKNIIRTLYAGYNNITIYSYPFWFINVLFVSSILFNYLLWKFKKQKHQKVMLAFIIIFLYAIIHIHKVYPLHFPLPWGIDQMLGAIVFIYIGYILQNKIPKTLYTILPVIAITFTIFILICDYNYELNMQKMQYDNFIFDLIVPCSFAMLFYELSLIITKMPIGNKILEKLGKASMTIFFTHAAIFCFIGDEYPMIRIVVALTLGYLVHQLLLLHTYSRLFFIGEYGGSIYKQKS